MRDLSAKTWKIAPDKPIDISKVDQELRKKLADGTLWTGAQFPPDVDVLLVAARSLEDTRYTEYFHTEDLRTDAQLSDAMREIVWRNDGRIVPNVPATAREKFLFPVNWMYPAHLVNLWGHRGRLKHPTDKDKESKAWKEWTQMGIVALLPADVLWLFFHERMGLFRMLGSLLDDFATKGAYAIDAGPSEAGWPGVVLESLVRATKSGLASRARDRAALYLRCLGWVNGTERPEGVVVNSAFNEHFHRLLRAALEYSRQKRIIDSFPGGGAAASGTQRQAPSSSAVAAVRAELDGVRDAMRAFEWGRCQNEALAGIATVVGTFALLHLLRDTLGVPSAQFQAPQAYIPALYDRLVGGTQGPGQPNRYSANCTCADAGRAILLDVPFLPTADEEVIRTWLDDMENKFEDYRSAYLSLTGKDVGADDGKTIQQAA